MAPIKERSKTILSHIVEEYLRTGVPVSSKSISCLMSLSSATVRNAMMNLVDAGLLFSPHTSAGRIPTESGLRFFVRELLAMGDLNSLTPQEHVVLEGRLPKVLSSLGSSVATSLSAVLEDVTTQLAGLSQCAGLVMTQKSETSFRHVEFLPLEPGYSLVVMVTKEGEVENRVIQVPLDIDAEALTHATNYINSRLKNATLHEAKKRIEREMEDQKLVLSGLSRRVVELGLDTLSGSIDKIVVRGQSHLLRDAHDRQDVENIRNLMEVLEAQETIVNLLSGVIEGQGVQIFIGSESPLFNISGCSVVVAPYAVENRMLGAVGVIGPSRMDYSRVIPLVNFTAQMMARHLEQITYFER